MIRLLIGSLAVCIVALSILGFMYKSSLETVAIQRKNLESANTAISKLEQNIAEVEEARKKLALQSVSYQNELSQYERELAQYRGREDVVAKKPGLVALKINRAFEDLQLQLACETGDTTACLKN